MKDTLEWILLMIGTGLTGLYMVGSFSVYSVEKNHPVGSSIAIGELHGTIGDYNAMTSTCDIITGQGVVSVSLKSVERAGVSEMKPEATKTVHEAPSEGFIEFCKKNPEKAFVNVLLFALLIAAVNIARIKFSRA